MPEYWIQNDVAIYWTGQYKPCLTHASHNRPCISCYKLELCKEVDQNPENYGEQQAATIKNPTSSRLPPLAIQPTKQGVAANKYIARI